MTLFSNVDPDETNYDEVTIAEGEDFVSKLVGDGLKFKDANALAKGKMQSDLFIQKLIQEKRQLESELQKRQSVEEIFNKLKSEPPVGNPPPENRQEQTGLKPEDVNRIVSEAISQKTKEQTEAQNLNLVTQTLEERLGPSYSVELSKRVKDLGIGEEFATNLAKTNPKAFLKLVGADTAPTQNGLFNPPRNELRAPPKVQNEKTYSYYEKLRKTDPAAYYASQREMFEQATRLGDAFYQ